MKRLVFLLVVLALASLPAVSMGYPEQSWCLSCHPQSPAVNVSAVFLTCQGTDALYSITVSDTFDGAEGWAVMDSGLNVANGTGTFGTVSLPVGNPYPYFFLGVSDAMAGSFAPMGRGNYKEVFASCGPVCTDHDNDGYAIEGGPCGPIDCNDYYNYINPGAPEICTGNVDEDCDALRDCADVNCENDPACLPVVEICTDGIDNDGDGYTDCADSECVSDPACIPQGEICTDGIDNDGDRKVDCRDRDCASDPACAVAPEVCNDAIDNDKDGKIDCKDRDCLKSPYCN